MWSWTLTMELDSLFVLAALAYCTFWGSCPLWPLTFFFSFFCSYSTIPIFCKGLLFLLCRLQWRLSFTSHSFNPFSDKSYFMWSIHLLLCLSLFLLLVPAMPSLCTPIICVMFLYRSNPLCQVLYYAIYPPPLPSFLPFSSSHYVASIYFNCLYPVPPIHLQK